MNDPEELLVAFQLNRFELRLARLWGAVSSRNKDLSCLGEMARQELMRVLEVDLNIETMDPAFAASDLGIAVRTALEEKRVFEVKERRKRVRASRRRQRQPSGVVR